MNVLEPITRVSGIVNGSYQLLVEAKPRDNGGFFSLEVKEEWDFNNSVFKDYKPDNEEILNRCFEADWKLTKLPKLVKDEDQLA